MENQQLFSFIVSLCFISNLTTSQTCNNSTFPYIRNYQVLNLHAAPKNVTNFNECELACCAEQGCRQFIWCRNDNTTSCQPKNSCFIGDSYEFWVEQSGWFGRAMVPPIPPFAFTNVHGNYMVLQQSPNKAQIFGTAPNPNDIITVTLIDMTNNNIWDTVNSTVDQNYSWIVQLAPQPASSKEYKIIATSAINNTQHIELTNILFGDVYLCSGQSNMQFTVDQAFNVTQSLIEANNYPNIRLFTVPPDESPFEINQLHVVEQQWSIARNTSVGAGNWSYFSCLCWFYGKNLYDNLKYPIGLIASSDWGTPIREWMSVDALSKCPNETYELGYQPAILWNAMIYPFLRMTIKGTIWYQGEQDSAHFQYASIYDCAIVAMINDWRLKWSLFSDTNNDFPFGYVQLSTWNDGNNKTCNGDIGCLNVATVRYGQSANYGYVPNEKLKNVYMATAIDLGDPSSPFGDVHSRYKQQVAKRLANAALNVIYGQSTIYWQGPIAKSAYIVNGKNIIINFRNVNEMGLYLNRMIGFEVYDKSKMKWIYINPNVNNIQLNGLFNISINYMNNNESIAIPTQIRYNWYTAPCAPIDGIYGCSIYDKQEYLPSTPFVLNISDSFP